MSTQVAYLNVVIIRFTNPWISTDGIIIEVVVLGINVFGTGDPVQIAWGQTAKINAYIVVAFKGGEHAFINSVLEPIS